ncbi:hypothetical protein [Gordonia sp. KTR9]|uniref:hypothetical protein n=1 Tax=Gordonia sp. KTR9 TaxID=337191 RepID=UPI00027DDE5B|nr:hypothetical protein [Gordonia sp. KTR9]AFR48364.1 hypothetical protein KTR9_1725 [Gordonia sp. KTR9]
MTSPEKSYNTYGSRNERMFGGDRTQWAGMSIDEILGVLSTMEPGRARGDVETILKAIESVRRAAERMQAMFGDGMLGVASDAALEAGRSLSADLTATSDTASRIGDALTSATGILGSARGQEGRLRELQQHIRDNPEDAPSVRHEADRTMTGAYSSPMIGLQHSLPHDPTGANGVTAGLPGAATGGGPGTGGTGSDAARGQAGNTVDAGDFGRPAPSGAPAPVGAVGPPPGGGGPGPSSTPSGSGGPPSGPSGRGSTDGSDGLLRGGRATPESTTRGAATPGSHAAGADGTAESGSRAGASGSGAGAGADVPASTAVPAFLSPGAIAPPLSALPATPTPATPTAGTPTPASPAGPVAQRPAGMPPAGVPGGGRRPGADDDRHRAAPYLHNREHGAEIVGDMPLVGPPVIGDWIRQTFPAVADPPAADSRETSSPRSAPPGDTDPARDNGTAAQTLSGDDLTSAEGPVPSKPEPA